MKELDYKKEVKREGDRDRERSYLRDNKKHMLKE